MLIKVNIYHFYQKNLQNDISPTNNMKIPRTYQGKKLITMITQNTEFF